MSTLEILLDITNGYKTYIATILMAVAGIASILAKHFSDGASDFFQALALLLFCAILAGLRHAIHKVPTRVLVAAKNYD